MLFQVKYSNSYRASSASPPFLDMVPGRADDWDGERLWYPKGCNVAIPENDWEDETATLEVSTLEELWALQEQHGRLIIGRTWDTKEPQIEIYNGLRE